MNSKLRHELFTAAALGSLLLAIFFMSPLMLDNWLNARQRLLQSLLVWAVVWQQLWHNRLHNRSTREHPPFPSLGWANRLTVARGGLIAACAGFLWLPAPASVLRYLPAVFYTLAVVADYCDGAWARRGGTTTVLGAKLDMSYDAIGLVVAPLLAIHYHKIHPSYLLVSAAFYLFLFGTRWRRHHKLPVQPLPPSVLRRTLAGMQMGVVAAALWPPIKPHLSQLAGIAFMLPLLLGFCIDWLAVSGRIAFNTDANQALLAQLTTRTAQWVLPALRLLLAAALWTSVLPIDFTHISTIEWGLMLATVGILCGVGGRFCAIALLLLLNWYPGYDFIRPAAVTTLFAATAVLLLGTGRRSVFTPATGP